MKRSWRWPLAGFLLGGLVGATFLTVNVVGASGPNGPREAVPSFGEILHTPPLLTRAGKAVELSFDVVCGIVEWLLDKQADIDPVKWPIGSNIQGLW
jgi:hypothetical protein